MNPKLSVANRAQLLKDVLEGRKTVTQACHEQGISRTLFYRWLKRYKESGLDDTSLFPKNRSKSKKSKVFKKKKEFSKEEFDQFEVSRLASKYQISRTTVYKWVKQLQEDKTRDYKILSRPYSISRKINQLIRKFDRNGLRRCFEDLPVGLVYIDSNLVITKPIRGGYFPKEQRNQFEGMSLYQILNAADPKNPLIKLHCDTLKYGQKGYFLKNLAGINVYCHIVPELNDQKDIVGCITIFFDIDRIRVLEKEFEKLLLKN